MKNQLLSRTNTRLVFNFLFDSGDHSVADITEGTGLSAPTVAKCLTILTNEGLVRVSGKQPAQRGRIPTLYGIDAGHVFFLGVDAKSDGITAGVISARGDLVHSREYAFKYENSPQTLTRLIEKVNGFLDGFTEGRDNIIFANFNISGRVNSESGCSYSLFNFEDNGKPLADILSEALGIPCSIENDTRAMATAENILGAGKTFRDYIYINISTGIGLSIISEGKIMRGRDGYSGEMGHIALYNNDIICHCGKKGCLETEVSGRALCRKFTERINAGEQTILSGKSNSAKGLTETDIFNAALKDDPLAIELIGELGDKLGKTIASLINVFNPEAVILAGNFTMAGRYFIEPTLYGVTKYSLARLSKDVVIRYSDLKDAGIRGAGLIACNKYFNTIKI